MPAHPISGSRKLGGRKAGIWQVHEVPRQDRTDSSGEDTGSVIADMVSILSANEHGSTADALAFLRQLYPRYPLTLRLAALVAHSRTGPVPYMAERPVAR